jgi:ribonuclease BN (tRNA processing enzyme)
MNLQLSIHSSPRFATWIWIPDWRLLIDAGDGATQQLGYKIRKIDTVALTHSHRDHIGGLLQVVNQRGEAGSFAVAHPCGSKSFGQLENFANKFNPVPVGVPCGTRSKKETNCPAAWKIEYSKPFALTTI